MEVSNCGKRMRKGEVYGLVESQSPLPCFQCEVWRIFPKAYLDLSSIERHCVMKIEVGSIEDGTSIWYSIGELSKLPWRSQLSLVLL